ncbi:MAG: MFS transporter [Candidatus Aminicenantes bacterium]|nr:MFS transporter [Candidatus Aminicenantes bacterium]
MPDRPKLLPAVMTIVAAATLALMGYEMARSAASSIFLAHYHASRLTEALMLLPLVMILLTYAISRLLRRFGPSATYALTLVVSGLVLAATATAARRGVRGSAFVLYVFAQAYIVLIVEQSWAFINSLFSTEDSKRWNGVIIAATTAGSVTGGLLTGLLSERIGSEQVVLCAAVLTVAAMLLSRRAFRQAGPERTAADRQPERLADHFAWDLLRSDPTLGRLALMVIASQSISVLFDIAFHRSLQAAMPLQEPRTAFLGFFFGGVNAVAFGLQLGLCPRLLRRFQVRHILAAIPLLYGAAALAGVALPLLPVLGAAFFLSKTVDYSVFRASKEVLYVPLPFSARYRGKMTIDALIYRSTKGAASALLSLAGLVAGVLPLRLYPLLAIAFGGFWNRVSLGLPEPKSDSGRSLEGD